MWERPSGRPVHPAIVWQDRRTAEILLAARARRPRGPDPRTHPTGD
ncbi:MAG: hypothetical protein OEM67_05475 [Thermoleophilia bacterium]|nr:hypothetical protein [Thermoleophilia bacterium]MDH3724336.1 hypothetical protein [Thermoleophilia bacterium]